MTDADALYSPRKTGQYEIKIKGSRFIADIFPVESEDAIETRLEEIRKRERHAKHHCFAWRLGLPDTGSWRVNDDGEPAGTAGKPMLQALDGENLTNVLAIVTRYFGGVKLGKGGLVRAYGEVVKEALTSVGRVPFKDFTALTCTVSFEHSNLVYRLIEQYGGTILDQDYGEQVTMTWQLESKQADKFSWELFEASQGTIKCHPAEPA